MSAEYSIEIGVISIAPAQYSGLRLLITTS